MNLKLNIEDKNDDVPVIKIDSDTSKKSSRKSSKSRKSTKHRKLPTLDTISEEIEVSDFPLFHKNIPETTRMYEPKKLKSKSKKTTKTSKIYKLLKSLSRRR